MSSRRWAIVVPAGLLLGVTACSDSDPPNLVRKTIGPSGGLVSSHDNVLTIVFQPGALSSEVEVEVFPSDVPPLIFGPAYRVRPDIELAVEAEITYRRVLPSNPNAATVGAIRLDDYTSEMGYWRPLTRLALNAGQQSVIATDDELSLYYGLLEDADAPPLPTDDGNDDDPPPGDDGTTTGTSMDDDGTTSTGGDDGETTMAIDPTTGGSTDDGPPPGTTTTQGGESTDDGMGMESTDDGGMGMESTDDGMMGMPMCSDGMPFVGELCLVASGDYPTAVAPIDVGLGNFDADPALDVVTLNVGPLDVEVLPGNGDGTFAAGAGGTAVGASPVEMAVGDFTGEGVLDVVVLDTAANSLGLLQGNGAAGFGPQANTMVGLGVVDLSGADFDGNASRDVAVLNVTDATVQMILGGGAGLMPGPTAAVGMGIDASMTTGSLNAGFDMVEDIIGVGAGGYHAWATDGTGAGYIADVVGAFGGGDYVELASADIDGDGNDDLVAIDAAGDIMEVGLSNGPAIFVFGAPVPVGTDPSDVALADLDGDGDLDAVVCNETSNDVMVFEWDAGAYALAFTFPTGMAPSGVAVGELSGDGVPDIVVSNEASDSVTVVLSDP